MKSRTIKRCSDCGRFIGENNFNWYNKRLVLKYKRRIV